MGHPVGAEMGRVPDSAPLPTNVDPLSIPGSQALGSGVQTSDPRLLRTLSPSQLEAIRAAMRLFVDDDLVRGAGARAKLYCDACQSARPCAGFIQYDRYGMCNGCATEFEVARARGQVASAGQFVRDKHFGEEALYTLSD